MSVSIISLFSGQVVQQKLPVLTSPTAPNLPNLKRLMLAQGELAQIHNGADPVRYMAVFELRQGGIRGNHFHKQKRESIYLIAGRVLLAIQALDTQERRDVEVEAGDLVYIAPGVAHALKTLEPGWALEFAPEPLDPADSFRHPLFQQGDHG